MKHPKLQTIIKKFAPKGTLVNTWQIDEDTLIIRKVRDYVYQMKYKIKK